MLLLNALAAVSVRMLVPWSGSWVADVEYDLGPAGVEVTGPAVLTIDREVFVGTVDGASSGRLGPKGRARVVGGAGGWEKTVGPKDYTNDAGVLSTAVYATTAAEVLERVVDVTPERLGNKYVRAAGPASRVLSGRDWHVDATGTTIVGPRLPVPALPTVQILDWDPSARMATLAADALVSPGTMLTDTRFGQLVVRDVEQTWSDGGARTRAWCMPADGKPEGAGSRILAALGAAARESTRAPYAIGYRYRVVKQGTDGRLTLQAVRKVTGVPDEALVEIAFGVPGIEAKIVPGSIVYVEFVDGDASQPRVVAFEAGLAIQLTINGGVQPAARMGDTVLAGPFAGVITSGSPTVKVG